MFPITTTGAWVWVHTCTTHTRAHHTLTHSHTWYIHYNILTPHTHTHTHAFIQIYYTMHTHTYLQISSEKITTGPAICSEPRCSACLQLSVQFSEPSSSSFHCDVLTQSARSSALRSPLMGLQITLLSTLKCRCCWRYHTWYPMAHSSLSSRRAPTSQTSLLAPSLGNLREALSIRQDPIPILGPIAMTRD